MRGKPRSKRGAYGTLYRFTIEYTDPGDPGFGTATWSTWAYDQRHAVDRFLDSGDERGFEPVRIARQQEDVPPHRWTWHKV